MAAGPDGDLRPLKLKVDSTKHQKIDFQWNPQLEFLTKSGFYILFEPILRTVSSKFSLSEMAAFLT